MSNTELGKVLQQSQTAQLTHPLPIIRAKEIEKWSNSPEYDRLLNQTRIGYNDKSDHKGGWRNW